jgi:N-acetyl-anhydromuramyl-L-alanine amidase AmpD
VLAVAPAAAAPVTRIPASRANYAHAPRPASAVRLVVLHVVEGSYWGAISWFRNPRARVSAHYVVSRQGAIAEMVPPWNVAWHAGNGWVNRHSIGVENEGFTGIPWTFTDREYRSCARLVASLLRRYLLPIDRRHVIGHAQVPDPFHPWLSGGFSHHTDPGRYWDWARVIAYTRSYARRTTPPPRALDVTTNLGLQKTLTGSVRVQAFPAAVVPDRIEFRVDGSLRETVRTPPYLFAGGAWNTTAEANGRHVVDVRAVAPDGTRADAGALVTVANRPPKVTAVNLDDGEEVTGVVRVEPTILRRAQRVELLVDGVVRVTSTTPPYFLDWDTTAESEGEHRLTVRAVLAGRAVSARSVFVVVASPPEPAAP